MQNKKENIDFTYICKIINSYNKLTSLEIQNQLKPIIKHFGVNYLSECIGISKDNLKRICKTKFVTNNERVNFTTYIRIITMMENQMIATNK